MKQENSEFVRRWWPLTASLDLVRAPAEAVGLAVQAEVSRFVAGEQLSCEWVPFSSVSEIFESVREFTNVPTLFFVLPSHSDWTVLWNNSFLCDGYDSLCHCLTSNHGMTTVHWQSSNDDAVFQAGSLFTVRRQSASGLVKRSVYCGKNDLTWVFHESGEVLPEEDTAAYTARRICDRLDEQGLTALLSRLGAEPWNDSFYRLGRAFRIERVAFPRTISRKRFGEFAVDRQ